MSLTTPGSRTPRTWRFHLVVRRGRLPFTGYLLAAVLALAGCATAPRAPDSSRVSDEPDVFEANREQALKDRTTPEGQAYARVFHPAIGEELARLLDKCTREFPSAGGASFEMVFRIDHFAEPKAVLVKPVTELSECVARGAWYFEFPRPDEKYTGLGVALLVPVRIE